uniref:Tyrosine-protein phosphatase non-receptor type 20 n=1 Tax=Eptatretus burgeri TaxID=7764 RepID=A0A8C4NM54_EPTBU
MLDYARRAWLFSCLALMQAIMGSSDLPAAPSAPQVTETTATSVTLSWSHPESITSFSIEYRLGNEPFIQLEPVPTSRYTIGGLSPSSFYQFRVRARSAVGLGPPSRSVNAHTGERAFASPPRHLKAQMLTAGKALVSWQAPADPAGHLVGYKVYWTDDADLPISSWEKQDVSVALMTTLSSLSTTHSYVVRVRAVTSEGDGLISSPIQLEGPLGGSFHPTELKAEPAFLNSPLSSLQLSWKPPTSGSTHSYHLYVIKKGSIEQAPLHIPGGSTFLLENLIPDMEYVLRLCSTSPTSSSSCTAPLSVRSPPLDYAQSFSIVYVTKSSVWVTWHPAAAFRLRILCCNRRPQVIPALSSLSLISKLQPSRSYELLLTPSPPVFGGVEQRLSFQTAPDLMPHPPTFDLGSIALDGIITLNFKPPTQQISSLRAVYIVLVPFETTENISLDNINLQEVRRVLGAITELWEICYSHHYLICPYFNQILVDGLSTVLDASRLRRSPRHSFTIAAQLNHFPTSFSLGNERDYGGYFNEPLSALTLPCRVFCTAVLDTQPRQLIISPPSSPLGLAASSPQTWNQPEGQLWVLGPVLSVLFIIAIVTTIIHLKRKRTEGVTRKGDELEGAGLPESMESEPTEICLKNDHSSLAVLKEDFALHVEHLSAGGGRGFQLEYESLDQSVEATWTNSMLDVNQHKNRFTNVVAFDHSRVCLSATPGIPGSDYINANYIDGYNRPRAYIATQSPLPSTMADFWRMVWEQRCSNIVLLCSQEDEQMGKCNRYWPERGKEIYADFTVSLLDAIPLASYTVRTFILQKESEKPQQVRQWHVTCWTNQESPPNPTAILVVLRRLQAAESIEPTTSPLLIHCSSGVGQSGCFAALHASLQQLRLEGRVNIPGIVKCLRCSRPGMIQSLEQYIWINMTIVETLTCPEHETEVDVTALASGRIRLITRTRLDTEFELIFGFKPLHCPSALRPCNKFKNRDLGALPMKESRVSLQPIRGLEGSDYINASYIVGYRHQKAYIATQGPLADTVDDFWRMLWETGSTIIVMLSQLRELGMEMSHCYWPVDRSAYFQYFVVDPMAEYSMPQYVLREFKVTDARDGQARTVRQFHFSDWPPVGVPPSGEEFVDFIGQVHKTKEQFGQDGPITVHCRNSTTSATRPFLSIWIVLTISQHRQTQCRRIHKQRETVTNVIYYEV